MADFLATHDMSSFLINPVMAVDNSIETFQRISVMSSDTTTTMPKVRFDDFPLLNNNSSNNNISNTTGNNDDENAAKLSSIQDFFNHRLSSSHYSSEEESASPRGSSDGLSMRSFDEDAIIETPKVEQGVTYDADITVEDLFLKPEQLASSCVKIEHRCNRAQAVTLKTVGKPKVVSMAKSSNNSSLHSSPQASPKSQPSAVRPPSRDRAVRPALTHSRTGSRRSIRPSLEAVVRVSRVLEEELGSDEPPAAVKPSLRRSTTVAETSRPQMNRQPSIPLLRAATSFDLIRSMTDIPASTNAKTTTATTATPPRSRGVLVKRSHTTAAPRPTNKHSVTQNDEILSPTDDSPSRRRLHRLASSFSLSNASDLIRRKSSIASLRKSLAAPPIPTEPLPQPNAATSNRPVPREPAAPIPRRRSSVGKLTPRGATERAPILVLPPHPDEEDEEDDDFLSVSPVEALQKWDRSRARNVAKASKERPSIDDIVARLL